MSGVSAGSINSAAFGVWEIGKEVEGSEELIKLWGNLKTEELYVKREMGDAQAMFEAPSLYDTSPGVEFLKEILGNYDGFKKKVSASAVDANTGNKVTFTDEDVDYKDFHMVVIGSASVPVAFPPTKYKHHLLMDGMTAYNTDVQATINRCKEITGNDTSMITVDII